jgi:hypothetical protein
MTNPPTPATAGGAGGTLGPLNGSDAVIARWFIDTYGQSFAVADKSRRDITAALTAAGFVIRRATPAAEPGMVTIDYLTAHLLVSVCRETGRDGTADYLESALATAADPAPGEGENEDDIVTTGHWMDKPEGFSP